MRSNLLFFIALLAVGVAGAPPLLHKEDMGLDDNPGYVTDTVTGAEPTHTVRLLPLSCFT